MMQPEEKMKLADVPTGSEATVGGIVREDFSEEVALD